MWALSSRRGQLEAYQAAGVDAMEWHRLKTVVDPIGRKKMPSDSVPRKMISLLLELIRSEELPYFLHISAWQTVLMSCIYDRNTLAAELVNTVPISDLLTYTPCFAVLQCHYLNFQTSDHLFAKTRSGQNVG